MINPQGNPIAYYYVDDVSVIHGSCAVGVNEVQNQKENIILFPNPTNGIINLKNANGAFIELCDASGRILKREYYHSAIDLNEFENGIYFLKLIAEDNRIYNKKFILFK